tara:strand:+ start:1385 stop:1531 length:147 start_codon:yes stop_codon:yes gene_type:complete
MKKQPLKTTWVDNSIAVTGKDPETIKLICELIANKLAGLKKPGAKEIK